MNLSQSLPMLSEFSLHEKSSPTKPNFFIVGAPKCGTTSMHYYLKQHPDIYMSTPKEPFYFGSDLDSHQLKTNSKREYYSFFSKAESESIVGESTVWYLYSKKAAREIRQFNSNSKIIVMLRNPVDAMHALHSQFVFSGNEPIEDFAEALKAEQRRKRSNRTARTTYYKEGLFYRDVYRYTQQIKRYFNQFGRENVKVITLNDLKKDPKGCYESILDFLDVESFTPESFQPQNSNCQLKSDFLRQLVREMPGDTLSTLREIVPVRPCAEIWDKIKPILVDEFPRSSMNPEIRKQLTREFQPEISRLEELLDEEFTSWRNRVDAA